MYKTDFAPTHVRLKSDILRSSFFRYKGMKSISIDLTPEEYHVPELMRRAVARQLGVDEASLEPLRVVRRTLDCRRRNVVYHCLVDSGQWTVAAN